MLECYTIILNVLKLFLMTWEKCYTLIMKQVHQNTSSGYLWVIYLRDDFYYLKIFSWLSILNKLLLGGVTGTKNKSWTEGFLVFSVCLIFTVNELIPVYSFFLEVKQLELLIYSNGSNENKLVNPMKDLDQKLKFWSQTDPDLKSTYLLFMWPSAKFLMFLNLSGKKMCGCGGVL